MVYSGSAVEVEAPRPSAQAAVIAVAWDIDNFRWKFFHSLLAVGFIPIRVQSDIAAEKIP